MDPVLVSHYGYDQDPPRYNLISVWKGGYGGDDQIQVGGRVKIEGKKDEVLAFLKRIVDMVEKA